MNLDPEHPLLAVFLPNRDHSFSWAEEWTGLAGRFFWCRPELPLL